jgi:hypothetical protein
MFDHKNLALGGFYPGLVTTRSIANLGTFDVEVIIPPVVPSGGGGGYFPVARNQKPERYRVTVRVSYNGKRYEDSVIVDDYEARVIAKKNGIKIFTETDPMVSLNGVQVTDQQEIIVRAKIKTAK